MLRSLRTARFGQTALWIAGVLAITGAFGLHPEPALTDPAAASSARPEIRGAVVSAPGADTCPACLAHRPVSAARLATGIDAPAAAIRVSRLRPAAPLPLHSVLPHEGRAPPTLG
jgi:hypothetical protein